MYRCRKSCGSSIIISSFREILISIKIMFATISSFHICSLLRQQYATADHKPGKSETHSHLIESGPCGSQNNKTVKCLNFDFDSLSAWLTLGTPVLFLCCVQPMHSQQLFGCRVTNSISRFMCNWCHMMSPWDRQHGVVHPR